jgi:hypothetical protein
LSSIATIFKYRARNPNHRLDGALYVFIAGRPGAYTDSHGAASAPLGPTAPARAVTLNGVNDQTRLRIRAKRDQDLVQDDIV